MREQPKCWETTGRMAMGRHRADGSSRREARLSVSLSSWPVCSLQQCKTRVGQQVHATCCCSGPALAMGTSTNSQVPLHVVPLPDSPARGSPERTTIRSLLELAANKLIKKKIINPLTLLGGQQGRCHAARRFRSSKQRSLIRATHSLKTAPSRGTAARTSLAQPAT